MLREIECLRMKRKTKNILLGMVAVIIAAVAGVAAHNATH